jgi:hypothetical protein
MNDITQAIGELTQGGLAARAVEPAHGEGPAAPASTAHGHAREDTCLNCGTALVGTHCHACGQRSDVHRTLGAFFHDLLHGVLHFEGKLWRTLPMLAFHPGRLTREYIDGRRASYISPIAMFLFVIFLFFALFHALVSTEKWAEGIHVNASAQTEQAYRATVSELTRLRARLAREDDADDRARLQRDIGNLEQQQAAMRKALAITGSDLVETGDPDTPTENRIRNAWQRAKENPQLLIYKLETNAYKFAWLLIPISVPFVALTFLWRRRFGLYDHTIFTTYSITFMFALVGLVTLISYFWSGRLGMLLLLYAPAHMYWQLRGTYALGRFSAFWRMLALSAFAWVAIVIFAGAMTAMAEH